MDLFINVLDKKILKIIMELIFKEFQYCIFS